MWRIAFRVDASRAIGMGHLRRCLTLAQALRRRGAEVLFLARAHTDSLDEDIGQAGFERLRLSPPAAPVRSENTRTWAGASQEEDAAECARLLDGLPLEALVVDHYGLDARWERLMRAHTRRLLAIDDLADRPHDCDILLDALPADPRRYDRLTPLHCEMLLGPRYALLRPEFSRLRAGSSRRSGQLRRLLLAFGAIDAKNYGGAAYEVVRATLGPDVEVEVVLGRLAPHAGEHLARAQADPRLQVHVDTPEVAQLMARADLAIGAGGTTSWERACLGLPSIVTALAPNQEPTVTALAAAGAAIPIGCGDSFHAQLRRALEFVTATPGLLGLLSVGAAGLTDGRGAERAASALLPPRLVLRPATPADARDLWEWRNAESVRAQSLSTEPIAWNTHIEWLSETLARADRMLLIGEEAGRPIGVLRFDFAEPTELSIYLTPATIGCGYGVALLRAGEAWIRDTRPDVTTLRARVRPGNAASIAAFRSAGYSDSFHTMTRDLLP